MLTNRDIPQDEIDITSFIYDPKENATISSADLQRACENIGKDGVEEIINIIKETMYGPEPTGAGSDESNDDADVAQKLKVTNPQIQMNEQKTGKKN